MRRSPESLRRGIKDGKVWFWVYPFRVATGYQSAIYGAGRVASYWTRVRNTRMDRIVERIRDVPTHDGDILVPPT